MVLFWFLVIALVVVVGAVTLAVLGGGEGAALPDAAPERLSDPLPDDRPVERADVESLRFPVTLRGYRMAEVDDALARVGAELAERDARITELETALTGAVGAAARGRGPGAAAAPLSGPYGREDAPYSYEQGGEADPYEQGGEPQPYEPRGASPSSGQQGGPEPRRYGQEGEPGRYERGSRGTSPRADERGDGTEGEQR
ncbi:DivIVA domain-containing protein [Streptomyces tsukubensis]|uniref:DivIVA domain-containing protein n=1 Tax=Streptomyces tsukubensis TaxID=83656 RepID=UPI00098FD052|nr:DivIVA domain-containing protein [Streptomyces tsukubensis]